MSLTSLEAFGLQIRQERKRLGITQQNLALASGTGTRFIVDLENGKSTCQIGKAFKVVQTLGYLVTLTPLHPDNSHGKNP